MLITACYAICNSRNGDDMNIEFTLKLAKLCSKNCDFVIEMVNLWNPNLIVDNWLVNGYYVNDNDRNVVLTNIDMIFHWKNNELMILMLKLWKLKFSNGDAIIIEFTLKLVKLCIIDCDLLFCNINDEVMKSKLDCW